MRIRPFAVRAWASRAQTSRIGRAFFKCNCILDGRANRTVNASCSHRGNSFSCDLLTSRSSRHDTANYRKDRSCRLRQKLQNQYLPSWIVPSPFGLTVLDREHGCKYEVSRDDLASWCAAGASSLPHFMSHGLVLVACLINLADACTL